MNSGYEYRERIGGEATGVAVLAHLAMRYRHSSVAIWRERIAAGEVRVDDRPIFPDEILKPGQILSWHRPPWTEPDVPLSYAVLWKDEHLLAVAKPAGLPTVPAGGYLENTLLALVRVRHPEAVPMHRLGRWTSGLVLFGLTPEARRNVARAWRDGHVRRTYRGLATGCPDRREFEVGLSIGPVPHPLLGTIHAASPSGKAARTHFTVVEQREGCFLADVVIATGRPHQIRIHLAAMGHPLVGEPLYGEGGRPARGCVALPGDPGYSLHAAAIRTPHPIASTWLDLTCAIPPSLRHVPG